MTTTTEPTAAATPSPGDDRRKKQVLLQKRKARNANKETRPTTPEQTESSPSMTPRKSTAYVSLRRKQIIEKRRNKESSLNKEDAKMSEEEKEQSPPPIKKEQPTSPTCRAPPFPEMVVSKSTLGNHEEPLPSTPQQSYLEKDSTIMDSSNEFVQEISATSPEEDRNDKVNVETKSGAWDTRSIHEFPPEPVVDPSWDASKTELFTKQQNEDMQKQMNMLENEFEKKTEEFSMFEDGGTFAAANIEDTNEGVMNVDCSLDVAVGVTDDELVNDAAHLICISEGEEAKPVKDAKHDHDGRQDDVASEVAMSTSMSEIAAKQADCSMDVHMGINDDFAMATHADRLLSGSKNKEVNANDIAKGCTVTALANNEVDFSATDLNNPMNILKDDEALLASDQVRSDVADGAESDAADAIRLLNQVEQQYRIEKYQSRNEDDSSSADDEEDGVEDPGEENFDEEEEVLYISADSEEEEELATHLSANDVPEIVANMPAQGATFEAAAASAALGENADRFQTELDNGGLVRTKSSSSGSFRDSSTAVESSVASSALVGAGVLSSAGASVVTEVTASSAASKGSITGIVDSAPPPPPSSHPPKKKKSSKRNISKKQNPMLMIPPPPPQKLKKWEEDKLRPMKHLQAVADAKAKSLAISASQEFRLEETSASEYVSLSLITSVSSSHSQDEIETSLAQSLPEEFITMISNAERTEKGDTSKQKKEVDESLRSASLNESQLTQRLQDMSFQDARSVDATSMATSFALLSPPHVSRTKLDEAAGLAPGKDGVWKEDGIKKKKSPVADKKMAERLAVASSTAATKFEEKYGDIDQEATVPRTMSSDSLRRVPVERRRTKSADKSEISYFCSPDMLNATSFCQPPDGSLDNDDENILSHLSTQAVKTWASLDGGDKSADPKQRPIFDSSFDDTHHAGMELVGGAFSTWKNSAYAYGSDAGVKDPAAPKDSLGAVIQAAAEDVCREELGLMFWLENDVLGNSTMTVCSTEASDTSVVRAKLRSLLQIDANFNALCIYASANITFSKPSDESSDSNAEDEQKGNEDTSQINSSVHPFLIPSDKSKPPKSSVLAANFISYLNRISLLSGVESPFKDENPFLLDVVTTSLLQSGKGSEGRGGVDKQKTVQDLIFQHELGEVVRMVRFFYQACGAPSISRPSFIMKTTTPDEPDGTVAQSDAEANEALSVEETMHLLYKVPTESPSPFETASWNLPSIVAIVLGFLGDPVAVCRLKMINHFCNRLIHENEHVIMRDAVRLGGIGMHIRPAFWMWITLEKCGRSSNAADAPRQNEQPAQSSGSDNADEEQLQCITTVLPQLERQGREGKWHHVIQRDVARAFGNMPPHKTGARLRTDSIVRALVTWGRGRVLSRGVKGGGVSSPTPVIPPPPKLEKAKSKPRPATGPPPWERGNNEAEKDESSQEQPGTVSQWSGISPVPSFCSNSGVSDSGSAAARANLANGVTKALEGHSSGSKETKNSRAIEELALCGNTLTTEMKEGLQNQLGYILHALAAAHEDVGYCQGMDYVVAHLLRVLQDTVRWHSVRGTLSPVIKAQPEIPEKDSDERSLTKEIDQAIEACLVVEETVFRVMDTFLMTYNLRHMYWPELRCLKTCCRVFERLIQMKLPVLADHFAYHELNVGLFALGWFQTLFLYLPSMPSATVCHMWDIWLVERSFKIFFRVGTAILFLSQPILLNHELEGMMTYLNTFPDATLLNPDILIACALQIKVTNRMLAEIERDLSGGY